MKSYKEFEKVHIGDSDIAGLVLRSPSKVQELAFGEDGSYSAYVVDGEVEIGEHYEKVYAAYGWLKIYDDNGLSASFAGNIITVYRSGDYGCIIQIKETTK